MENPYDQFVEDPYAQFAEEDPYAQFEVEEEKKSPKGDLLESAKAAGADFAAAADMIMSIPAFVFNALGTPAVSFINALKGDPNPLEKATKFSEEVQQTEGGKFAFAPLSTTLGVDTSGSVIHELFGKISQGIESGAQTAEEATGSSEVGYAARQLANVAMVGVGPLAQRVGAKLKGKEKPGLSEDALLKELEANKEAPVYAREPADMFPETQKTPYGTQTGEAPKWGIDENGMPVRRDITSEVQATESAPFAQDFKTPEFVGAKEAARTDPTQLQPQELPLVSSIEGKAKQPDLFFDEAAQKLDTASNQGELFKPLGQTGFGKGQRGSFTPFAKKELTPEQQIKSLSKEDWIKGFNERNPGKEQFAEQIHTRLKGVPEKTRTSLNLNDNVVTKALDYGFGTVSTRLGNLHPQLKQKMVDFEFYNLRNTWDRFSSSEKFLEGINLFSKEDKALVDQALMKGDYAFLSKNFPDKLKPEVAKTRAVLNEIGSELKKYGIVESLRENYFPRIVKDLDGMYKKIGIEKASQLQKIISEKEAKSGPLTDVELTDVTNRFLQSNYNRRGKPGFSKERVFDEVPPELQEFYMEPSKALDAYIRSATFQIEKAKFFGRHSVKDSTGRINLGESIGSYTIDLLNKKQIKPEQIVELSDLLHSRFSAAQRNSSALTQGAKDAVHLGLLSDFGNALIQNADIATSFAFDGIRPTLIAVLAKLRGVEQVNAKDFGLMNHIADDFVSDRWSTKWVTKVFKLNGLAKIDQMTKDFNMNASLTSAQLAAKKGTQSHYLYYEYAKRFGDEFPQLLEDLKAGRKTDLTDRFVFSELSNRQPISKSEYSQLYMESPNIGRGALVLKSFMLKQGDLYRNRVYNQMKENPRIGIANATRLSIALATMNTAWDEIRDFLAGKPMKDFEASTLPANLFKIFGYNEYFSEDIQRGAFGEAAGKMILPPYKAFDPLFKDIKAAIDGDRKTEVSGKWKTFVPFIGDEWYWRSEEGKKEKLKKEREMRTKQRREARE